MIEGQVLLLSDCQGLQTDRRQGPDMGNEKGPSQSDSPIYFR